MATTFQKQVDTIAEKLDAVRVEAEEEGLDAQADKLSEAIAALQEITFPGEAAEDE